MAYAYRKRVLESESETRIRETETGLNYSGDKADRLQDCYKPLLEYAQVVCCLHEDELKTNLEKKIQRHAGHFIRSRYHRLDSVTQMLQSCELKPLEARRQKNRSKVFFQMLHG